MRGHLFRWLIAYDISCAFSEVDSLMPANAKRSQSYVGGAFKCDLQIHNEVLRKVVLIICRLFKIFTTTAGLMLPTRFKAMKVGQHLF